MQDLIMNGRKAGRRLHQPTVHALGEARDVVGNRPGEQPVVLQHAADLCAVLAQAEAWIGKPCSAIVPLCGCSSPASILRKVVLPGPDGPMIATHSPIATSRLAPVMISGSLS